MAHRSRARSRAAVSVAAFVATLALVLTGTAAGWAVDTAPDPTPSSTVSATRETTEPTTPVVEDEPDATPTTPAPVPTETPVAPVPHDSVEPLQQTVPSAPASPLRDAAEVAPAVFTLGDGAPVDVAATAGSSGVVTFTGTVVDSESGAALSGVPIEIRHWNGGGDSGGSDAVEFATDSDGRFTATTVSDEETGISFGPAFETLHLGGFGYLTGTTLAHSYELGVVQLERGGLLTGTLTAPDGAVDVFPASVDVRDGQSYAGQWGDSVPAGGSTQWRTIVAPGTYTVQLSNGTQFQPLWWDGASRQADATSITVAAGETVAGIDGELVAGENSLSGTVRTTAGAPLAGVSVSVSSLGLPSSYYNATTDSQGRWLLGNVTPNTYRISFYPPQGSGVPAYYGGPTYDTAATVTVPAGTPTSLTGLDVTIQPGAVVTGVFPASAIGRIDSVSVSDADGRNQGWAVPAADGSFRIVDIPAGSYRLSYVIGDVSEVWGETFALTAGQEHEVDLDGFDASLATVTVTVDRGTTDARGTVEVLDADSRAVIVSRWLYDSDVVEFSVRPGDYVVRYSSSDGGPPIYYAGATKPADATVITLAADDAVAIALSSGTGRISGVVTAQADDAALADITVELYRANQLSSSPVANTTTDADGAYSFEGLGVNNYAVRAKGSPQLYIDRWFGPSGEQSDATAIELGDGGSYSEADLSLALGGGIRGTFPEALAGSPYAYLSITAAPTDGEGRWTSISGGIGSLIVDGSWSFLGLPAGTYRLSGTLDNAQFDYPEPITVVTGEITEGIELTLPPVQITGTVRAAATGQPVYAQVVAHWTETFEWGESNRTEWAYTDSATGEYRFSGLPVGSEVFLEFSRSSDSQDLSPQWWDGAAARETADAIVVPAAGETAFVADADLEPAVRVEGRVIDALTGGAVAGISVGWGVTTRTDGTFVTYVEAPGAVTLATRATDRYVASSTQLTVPAEGLDGVEIALDRGYIVSGAVAAANNGVPLSNVSLRIVPAHDRWASSEYVTTRTDGTFATSAIAPGRYKIEAVNSSGLYVSQWYDGVERFEDAQEIALVDTAISDIDVQLTLGGTVSGRIVDENGQPLAGATVGVATAPETGIAQAFSALWGLFAGASTSSPILDIETTTDASGNFRLPALEPGAYTLYVYTPDAGTTWYDGKATRAEADVIQVSAGQVVTLGQDVQLRPLAEGEPALTPEQTLSPEFAIVTAPTDVSVESGSEATFHALASGLPVPSVQWQRRDTGAQNWSDIENATDATLTLPTVALGDDGTEFRAVFTQGDETLESASATLSVTAAATVPAKPAVPAVTATGTTTADLEWTAPSDGGSPLTGYRLTLYAQGGTDALRTIPLGAVDAAQLGGLNPGTDYEVTLTAVNAIGASAPSARVEISTTALTAPGTPSDLAATTIGSSSLTLSWTAPTSDGGSPITGYRLVVSDGDETVAELTPASNATSASVADLSSDTEYSVSIAAVNAVGTGTPRVIDVRTAAEPTATPPGTPTGLTVTGTAPTQVSIAWSEPTFDGGSPITGYTVTVTREGTPVTASVTIVGRTAVIDGLSASTSYGVEVSAVNAIGTGVAASIDAETAAAPPTVPGSVSHVTAAALSGTSISVGWTAPSADGGAPVSGYDVTITQNGENVPAEVVVTGTTAVVGGLAPDTEYAVSVAARNDVGAGPASDPTTVRTAATAPVITAPTAPGTPAASVDSSTAVSLTWSAPSSDGGSPIVEYIVRGFVGDAETGAIVKRVTTPAAVVTGLSPVTTYTFSVEAVNEAGTSPASTRSAPVTTPASVPGAPGSVSVRAISPTEISVTWNAPETDGGSPVTGYVVDIANGDTVVRRAAVGTSLTVDDLAPGTAYEVTVLASNTAGTGAPSTVVPVTTPTAPSPTESASPTPAPSETPGVGGVTPPSANELTDATRGAVRVVSSDGVAGGRLVLAGVTPGASYDAWFFSAPISAGLVTADSSGRVAVTIPKALAAGEHRVVLTDPATGAVIGWTEVQLRAGLPSTGSEIPLWLPLTSGALTVFGLLCFAYARRQRALLG